MFALAVAFAKKNKNAIPLHITAEFAQFCVIPRSHPKITKYQRAAKCKVARNFNICISKCNFNFILLIIEMFHTQKGKTSPCYE